MANFTRDLSKELGPISGNNIEGIAFGDSTLFYVQHAGGEQIRRYRGGDSQGVISTGPLTNAQNVARRKVGLPTLSVVNIGRITHVGNSILLCCSANNGIIFAINTQTNLGDASRSFQVPFVCEGMTDSGDTFPYITTGSAIKEWNGTAWVDKISQTTLRSDLGDSSTNVWSLSSFSNDLFLITTKHIHLYRHNSYVSSYNLPYRIAPVGAGYDDENDGGIYIGSNPRSGQPRRILFFKDDISRLGFRFTTGDVRVFWDTASRLELSRVTTKEINLRERPQGVAFGDSTIFISKFGQPERIYKYKGDTFISSITQGHLFTAIRNYNRNIGSTTDNTINVSRLAHMGDTTLAIADLSATRRNPNPTTTILLINAATNAYKNHVNIPFVPTGMTDGGDTFSNSI